METLIWVINEILAGYPLTSVVEINVINGQVHVLDLDCPPGQMYMMNPRNVFYG